jgi:hypothetical protein
MNKQSQWLFEVPLTPQATYHKNPDINLADYNDSPYRTPPQRIDPNSAQSRLDEAVKRQKSAETKRDNAWFGKGRAKTKEQRDRAEKAFQRWQNEYLRWSQEVRTRQADLQAALRHSGQRQENEALFMDFPSEPLLGDHWLFEIPYAFVGLPDYSEGTGRKKAAKRINPRSIDVGDIRRGGVEPIRKPRPKPPRKAIPLPKSSNQSLTTTDPEKAARQKANQRGAVLTKHFINQLNKSNPSGTAVRPQAQIKAGTEMGREANKLRDPLLVDAYRTVGKQLIIQGKAELHVSKNNPGTYK